MAKSRKPALILKMQGTARKCRLDERGQELELSGGLPDPPAWLDKEAKEEWRRLLTIADYRPVIKGADQPALALWCKLVGKLARGEDFKSTEYPAFMALAGRFGLTPADRCKIRAEKPKEKANPFATFKTGT